MLNYIGNEDIRRESSYILATEESCAWCKFLVQGLKHFVESNTSSVIGHQVILMKLPFMLKMVSFDIM